MGRQDAIWALTRDKAVQRAAEICAVARVPVSVDAENGWGHDPADVAETVRMLASVGAAGATIEDWSGDPERGFHDRGHAVERIVGAVEAARALPEPFVVCARADVFLYRATMACLSSIVRQIVTTGSFAADPPPMPDAELADLLAR